MTRLGTSVARRWGSRDSAAPEFAHLHPGYDGSPRDAAGLEVVAGIVRASHSFFAADD